MDSIQVRAKVQGWQKTVKRYQVPNVRKAVIQILNSFLPYLFFWVLAYLSLDISIWLSLSFSMVAGAFLTRIFIIQHDCGHQSFFKEKKWNNRVGFVASILSSIPYKLWAKMHNVHHNHNGQYEYRGLGDIGFFTTEEFNEMPKWRQVFYRIRRSPLVQFVVVPIVYFVFVLRLPEPHFKNMKNVRFPHIVNNLTILAVYAGLAWLLGWQAFLIVHLPTILFFSVVAFWLFYIQHQHEDNYNEHKDQWSHLLASIQGSTYYKLPKPLQWITGNIGFHHIHHLNSRVPNYNLEACVLENPELSEQVPVLTLKSSLKCATHKLWDVEQQRMITFEEYGQIRKKEAVLA